MIGSLITIKKFNTKDREPIYKIIDKVLVAYRPTSSDCVSVTNYLIIDVETEELKFVNPDEIKAFKSLRLVFK